MVRKIDEDMIAKVDLCKNAVYIVNDGQLTEVAAKSHGEDIITWKNNKVLDVIRSERIRINGQDMV
ncbi:DUF3954 domain-containing protein [Rummeliibacillus pycnus]|uniref:DUF3954 domain-containing protein n=1 Tax=Rummeliibacillus pycnus TaxID=101070 RepID=UPI0037C57EEA